MTSLGNININNIYLGSTEANAAYLGTTKLWPESPEPTEYPGLCFTAEQANSAVRLDKYGSLDAVSLETSTDGTTWIDYNWNEATGDTIALNNAGDKVYFRAKSENLTFSKDDSNYYNFTGTGRYACSGNIQSLLKANCSRTDAPAVCYSNLFYQNSCITRAPEVPATTLGEGCYNCMFRACTNLVYGPSVLPATTLASFCYSGMFYESRALKYAPELAAATWDHNLDFNYTYGKYYQVMFYGCRSLNEITVHFTYWASGSQIFNDWVGRVASTGTFKCPAALPEYYNGAKNIPPGWTKVDI